VCGGSCSDGEIIHQVLPVPATLLLYLCFNHPVCTAVDSRAIP
jgi:hypothetical protein